MTERRVPTVTDLEFYRRLRSNEHRVLSAVVERYGSLIRQRLRSQFGARLNEDDLDDVLSAAQFRLWKYRRQYDPSRGSIGHWFYLIARSAAIDFVRQTPQLRLLSDEQWRAAAVSPSRPPSPSTHQLKTIGRVRWALHHLSDTDRQIVMTFAAAEGARTWSDGLSHELVMPPSTIRSRKHRAMRRLRKLLSDPEAYSGEKVMSDASFQFDSDALQEHSHDIEAVVDRLRAFYDVPNTSGLAFLATEWNRRLEEPKRDAGQERELLKQDYLWYLTLEKYEQEYRAQVATFLNRVQLERASDFARTSFAHRPKDAIDKLELALSEVSGTINLEMPNEVRRKGFGKVTVRWHEHDDERDAELFWEAEGQQIGLRRAIRSGLRNSARLSHEDVSFFTDSLINEVYEVHELELPEFHYEPDPLPYGEPPQRLRWEKSRTELADVGELPEWMKDEASAPEELQLELAISGREPELAALIDRVLCAAAFEDYGLSKSDLERRASAVEQLIETISLRVGVPRGEVVRLFAPVLLDRQSPAEGGTESATNTDALHFLLSQLTEH